MKRAVWKWLFYAKAPAYTTLGWDDICSKRNDCQECKEKDHLSRSVLIVAHSRTISSTRSQLVKHRRVVTSLVSIVLSSSDHIMVIDHTINSISISISSISIIMAGFEPVQVANCHLDVPKSSIQHLAKSREWNKNCQRASPSYVRRTFYNVPETLSGIPPFHQSCGGDLL